MEKEDNQQERSKRGRTRPPQSVAGLSEQKGWGARGQGDVHYTNENIFDNSYKLVTHFPDFLLWENRIANTLNKSNSVLPGSEIRDMCY